MVEKWQHFPIYMWAGPGTIRINKVKFPTSKVNEETHIEAGLDKGASRIAQMGLNWAYCTYNWGFPPEIEREDHEFFRSTVKAYHEHGIKVFGYVQFSNVVFTGSFLRKNWYAIDHHGERINYYSGRYLTCPTNREWVEHLKTIVSGIIEAGADGVFFDNVFGSWYAFRPCHCESCQQSFHDFQRQKGRNEPFDIPIALEESERTELYLEWRRKVLWDTIAELRDHAKGLKPDVLVTSNSFEAGLSRLSIMAGVDLRDAFHVQDLVMIENHQLPRKVFGVQVFNTLTYRIAHAYSHGKPVTSVAYMQGIGADEVYPTLNYIQGLAEAYSNDSVLVVKGTEYYHNGEWTLLSDDAFENVRREIGRYNTWFKDLMDDSFGERAARIGVFHPYDSLYKSWELVSAFFFPIVHELVRAGIDFRIVRDDFSNLDLLIVPPLLDPNEIRLVNEAPVTNKLCIGVKTCPSTRTLLTEEFEAHARRLALRNLTLPPQLVQELSLLIFRNYFEDIRWRKRLDQNGFLLHNYLQHGYNFVHGLPLRELLELAANYQSWKVSSDGFVVVTTYRRDKEMIFHLVNLEEREISCSLVLPDDYEVTREDAYTFDGITVHRIIHAKRKTD